jgi:hypothetical protein
MLLHTSAHSSTLQGLQLTRHLQAFSYTYGICTHGSWLSAVAVHAPAGFKNQVSVGGLPLKLSPEEVTLALQAGAASA